MQIKSSILSREVLPDVRSAYATISSKETHIVAAGSIADSSQRNQASAFVSNGQINMTYTDKELDNVLDISHLRIKHDWHYRLGHPAEHVLKVLKDSLQIDKKDNIGCCEICQRAKPTREHFPLSDHTFKCLGDLVHLDLCGPYKDSEVEKNDAANVFQDINHINFFDIEYPEIPNDDERVANDLNKGKSDSSSSSVSGSNINTADFLVDSGNDADSSDGLVTTQNEEVAHLKTMYKARLVAQGFGQKEGIDYEEIFSPVVKMVTVRCLLNIVVSMSWPVFQLDVNNAFLYSALEEAHRQWNAKLTSTLIENGFSQNDIIITGNSISKIEKFKVYLKSKFMIKDLGKLKYFLRIKVVNTDKGICLNQNKYVLDLLSKYGMLACKPAKTPLMSKLVISNEASDKDPLLENITNYQKLMGKLIYLTNTRPDISYVVHCLSLFMHSSLTSHLKIAFKILRYLKSCPGIGIHIIKTFDMFLNAYSDVDWAKCIVIRKSVTGNSAIKIAVNLVFHKRTKHLKIDLHFVREIFLNGVVKTVKVDSANQIADILTKGLDTIQHYELVKKIWLSLHYLD
ncbi:ribonuclease H-like domain-containing protein [Tanacetum coccineum]